MSKQKSDSISHKGITVIKIGDNGVSKNAAELTPRIPQPRATTESSSSSDNGSSGSSSESSDKK